MSYLLALDQSTNVSGWALYEDDKLLCFGHVNPSDQDYLVRIVKLRNWLAKVLDSIDNNIEVAIEEIQLQKHEPNGGGFSKDFGVTTFKKLAHVQGAILSLLVERHITHYIVSAAAWKKTCKVKGKNRSEQKRNAQLFVKEKYAVEPIQDEVDAICIGYHIRKTEGCAWS